MKTVYLAANSATAEMVRGLLEAAGIRAVVTGVALGSAVGDIPFTAAYPQVSVEESDAETAITLIRTSGLEAPAACPACGYLVQGPPTLCCPECGAEFPRREIASPWTCAACGETLEGQFTACWSCEAPRPSRTPDPE